MRWESVLRVFAFVSGTHLQGAVSPWAMSTHHYKPAWYKPASCLARSRLWSASEPQFAHLSVSSPPDPFLGLSHCEPPSFLFLPGSHLLLGHSCRFSFLAGLGAPSWKVCICPSDLPRGTSAILSRGIWAGISCATSWVLRCPGTSTHGWGHDCEMGEWTEGLALRVSAHVASSLWLTIFTDALSLLFFPDHTLTMPLVSAKSISQSSCYEWIFVSPTPQIHILKP